jgi:hypothetical protein
MWLATLPFGKYKHPADNLAPFANALREIGLLPTPSGNR